MRLIPLVVLWLCGICLRLTVLATPPVLPLLHAELHLSETQVGWLSSLPSLLFAVAAVPGALLIARFGLLRALLAGLLLNAAGSALRGAAVHASFLYVSTVVMAAGVSIMQPAMPTLTRNWFPRRVGFATAVYTNGLLVGEIVTVALTIPFVLPLVHDSWRRDFVAWSLPVVLVAALVAAFAPRADAAAQDGPAPKWLPDWRDPLIWRLGLILGSVNATYFAANAFLPDYVIAHGHANLVGSVLTALNFGQLPASLVMLPLAGRLVTKPWAYAVTGLFSTLCVAGILTTSGPWIVWWAGLLGFTGALTLVLALALPSVLSRPGDAHRTSAGMFTVSYSFAMALSVVVGWLWDATQSPLVGFAPVALCGFVIAALASTVGQAEAAAAPP